MSADEENQPEIEEQAKEETHTENEIDENPQETVKLEGITEQIEKICEIVSESQETEETSKQIENNEEEEEKDQKQEEPVQNAEEKPPSDEAPEETEKPSKQIENTQAKQETDEKSQETVKLERITEQIEKICEIVSESQETEETPKQSENTEEKGDSVQNDAEEKQIESSESAERPIVEDSPETTKKEDSNTEVHANETEVTEIAIQEGNLSDNVFETAMEHDPADIEAALDKMLKKKLLPAPEIRYEVINYARKRVADLMMTENYDEAGEIDIAIDIMTASIGEDTLNANASSHAANLQNRLENARQTESQITEKWDFAIASVKDISRQKLSDLEQYHNQEREEFLTSWERPEAKIPYSKPSPELLQIRHQQRAMALLHDFKSAKQMKQKAEELEKKEAVEGAKRYEASLKAAYKQLLDRQQREVQCLIENAEKHLVSLEQAKQKELGTVQNTKRSLEARIIKPANRFRRPDSTLPQLTRSRATTSQSMSVTTSTCPITQRTRSRLTSFRRTTDLAKLDIKTADARRIVKVAPGRKQRPLTSLSATL